MPLITFSGLPLSGKTTRAKELQQYLEHYLLNNSGTVKRILLVNEESLSIDKKTAYTDATSEKKARGAIMSAVERYLSREDIVICDSLNYIKGFRYQLYCIARALGTPSCTVFCGQQEKHSIEKNQQLDRYDSAHLENLCSRFEEPDGKNRWDAPIFIVIDGDLSLSDLGNRTSQQIVEAVILKKPPAPNLSTVVKPVFETNYLHELDKTTTDILDTVIEAQKSGRTGNLIVPRSKIPVCLPSRVVSLSELRRLKRQFLNINKSHTVVDMETAASSFADYLNTNLS
jgi:protein KTI12